MEVAELSQEFDGLVQQAEDRLSYVFKSEGRDAYERELRDAVKHLTVTAHVLAAGGRKSMGPDDWTALREAVEDSTGALKSLVKSQLWKERAEIGGRVFLKSAYGPRGELESALRRAHPAPEFKERRIVGKACSTCPHCTGIAFKGWTASGSEPEMGECGPDCDCRAEFKRYDASEQRDERGRWTSGGSVADFSPEDQARMKKLRVPPGWKDVKLNPDPQADLQVTGKDSKGRSVYLYSAAHSERMAAQKFDRLAKFNDVLPGIRSRIAEDLSSPDLSARDKESAAVLHLIDRTGFRVGSDKETGAKVKAYGASTLRAEHVKITGDRVEFAFTGKKGVSITKTVEDPALARMLEPRIKAGGRLFNTTDIHVRDYLHARDGDHKVKDFRTWHGTATALKAIRDYPTVPRNATEFAKAQMEVSKIVAAHLGNTPAIAKASYIDPAVWSRWKEWQH